jgi:GT2 family glycosyltransferase
MAVRNEGRFIERSLGAVLAQTYPSDRTEVIVVDGMSEDHTKDVVTRLAQSHAETGPGVVILDNPMRIVAAGLNAGIRRATGDIIVRVDGHTIIGPDYVRECVAALERSGAANVGGRMNAVGETAFGEAVALATSSPFGVGGARFHYSERDEFVDTVYMGAWRREVFQRIGFFDEEFVRNQDDELNYRLRSHGGKILLTGRIKSVYYNRSTLRSLWRQYFQYGYWKVRVLQKHPRQMQLRQFAPPLSAVALSAGLLSSLLSDVMRRGWIALMLVYVVANLVASIWIARRSSPRSIFLLPVAFATLHLSYGFGFLIGMIRFWNRWRAKPGDVGTLASA